jgi:hypothetical protein
MKPYSFASLFRTNASDHRTGHTVVAPFGTKPLSAAKLGVDTATGQPVPARFLQTYSDAIREYFSHPESKFVGDVGVLERRHLYVPKDHIVYIGKEGSDIEERTVGVKDGSKPYGTTGKKRMPERNYSVLQVSSRELLRAGIEVYGLQLLSEKLNVSRFALSRACETGRTRHAREIEEGLGRVVV